MFTAPSKNKKGKEKRRAGPHGPCEPMCCQTKTPPKVKQKEEEGEGKGHQRFFFMRSSKKMKKKGEKTRMFRAYFTAPTNARDVKEGRGKKKRFSTT